MDDSQIILSVLNIRNIGLGVDIVSLDKDRMLTIRHSVPDGDRVIYALGAVLGIISEERLNV